MIKKPKLHSYKNKESLNHQTFFILVSFYLFQSMQSALLRERFNSYECIKKWSNGWIPSKKPHFFLRKIRLLPENCKIVVASDVTYFGIRFIISTFFFIRNNEH